LNTREGFSRVDTDTENEPFDSIDTLLTRALWVLAGVAIGMSITAALVYSGRFF